MDFKWLALQCRAAHAACQHPRALTRGGSLPRLLAAWKWKRLSMIEIRQRDQEDAVTIEQRHPTVLTRVTTQVTYRQRDPLAPNDPMVLVTETLPYDPRSVSVADARPIASALDPETDGLCMVRRPSAVQDFFDQQQI